MQAGTRDEERSVFGEFERIERRHRPTCTAEENQITARTKDIQVVLESVFAHAVVNYLHALIAGQSLCFSRKILFCVDDHFISAGATSEFRLCFRPRGCDYARAKTLRHLHQQQPDATRRSTNQRRVASLYWIGAVAEIVGWHALQHCSRHLLGVEFIGKL